MCVLCLIFVSAVARSASACSVEADDAAEDLFNVFLHDIAVSVGHCYNGIRRFRNSLDLSVVQHYRLAVQLCEYYHKAPCNKHACAAEHTLRRTGMTGFILSLEVYKLFKHSIGNGYDTRVCLIASLRDDHIREFLGEVNVGHFQRALDNFAGTVCSAYLDLRFAGSKRRSPQRSTYLLKTGGVLECGDIYTSEHKESVYGMTAVDRTVGVYLYCLEVIDSLLRSSTSVRKCNGAERGSDIGEEVVSSKPVDSIGLASVVSALLVVSSK